MDSSCAPADIRHPTDLSLLHERREKIELIIEHRYAPLKGMKKRVKNYREKA